VQQQHTTPCLTDSIRILFLLLVHSKLLQILNTHTLQRSLICSLQDYLRHLLIIIACSILKRLSPPAHTKTPLAAIREPNVAQIVALCGAVVEKLVGDDARDAVVAMVGFRRFAIARAREAG
jgi:hypothetical protein